MEELLPRTNCGACGTAGCRQFAEKVINGEIVPNQCTVNNAVGNQRIADYLGVAAGEVEKQVARLACAGGAHVARTRARYEGEKSCRAASLVSGGGKGCSWGCLGLGDCEVVCDFDAITINRHGLPQRVYSLKRTQFLVIDEADRLFDMGFISDVRFLLRRMSPYNKRQSMLFSATLSHRVLELCYEYMNMPEPFTVTPEKITVEQVEQEIYHVGTAEKFGLLLGIIKNDTAGRYLIFCNTKAAAERLETLLNANGFATAAITGDLPQKQRMQVLSRFRDSRLSILVATDVARAWRGF